MRIPVSVPVMTCIKELHPSWSPNPMPVCMADPLHVALDWAMAGGRRLLECKLKYCPKLLPKSWSAFAPGVRLALRDQGLCDHLKLVAPSLGRPRVLLQEVLFCFGQPGCPSLCRLVGWNAAKLNHLGLRLVGCPRSEVNVRHFWHWWEVWHLSILPAAASRSSLSLSNAWGLHDHSVSKEVVPARVLWRMA